MSKLSAILLRLGAGLLTLLLCACFELREEYWVRADGTARAEGHLTVPKSAVPFLSAESVKQEITRAIEREPSLQLKEVNVTLGDGEMHVFVAITAPSIYQVTDLARPKPDAGDGIPQNALDLLGRFKIERKGLDVDLTRTINVAKALGFAGLAIDQEQREVRRLSYILHLPKPAVESNADRVEDGGSTLIWDRTLGDAMKRPVDIHFRAAVPLRTQWIVAAVILGGLLILLVPWLLIRIARSVKEQVRRKINHG